MLWEIDIHPADGRDRAGERVAASARELGLVKDLKVAAAHGFLVQGAALATEIRTPALWGLRDRRPLLHDGSATTIEEAILRHGAEAARARTGFTQLSDPDRAALIAFLKTL